MTLTYTTTSAGVTSAGQSFAFEVRDKDHKGAAGSVSVAVVTPAGAVGTVYGINAVAKS